VTVRAQRKPRSALRRVGRSVKRIAAEMLLGSPSYQPPPRATLTGVPPLPRLSGNTTVFDEVHSHTFPVRSFTPAVLSLFGWVPTAHVLARLPLPRSLPSPFQHGWFPGCSFPQG